MEVLEAIRTRRSIRRFTRDEVTWEEELTLIDAARWAPSAGNLQPWEFVVVRRQDLKERLASAALDQRF
ncbi:MAG TPA: nitroreductase family protein, partial [Candidatus Bathyarchaeota archaeon]|nr:nitroreductase family protein [Candidatus Bathyarchaeota archaeon]